MHQAQEDVYSKSPSFETILPESEDPTGKETALPFRKRVMAAHMVIKASEYASATVVESDSGATVYKSNSPFKSIARVVSSPRSQIERPLADFGGVTKTDVRTLVENPLTKWTHTL